MMNAMPVVIKAFNKGEYFHFNNLYVLFFLCILFGAS